MRRREPDSVAQRAGHPRSELLRRAFPSEGGASTHGHDLQEGVHRRVERAKTSLVLPDGVVEPPHRTTEPAQENPCRSEHEPGDGQDGNGAPRRPLGDPGLEVPVVVVVGEVLDTVEDGHEQPSPEPGPGASQHDD